MAADNPKAQGTMSFTQLGLLLKTPSQVIPTINTAHLPTNPAPSIINEAPLHLDSAPLPINAAPSPINDPPSHIAPASLAINPAPLPQMPALSSIIPVPLPKNRATLPINSAASVGPAALVTQANGLTALQEIIQAQTAPKPSLKREATDGLNDEIAGERRKSGNGGMNFFTAKRRAGTVFSE
ncbi:hypothetical protein KEM48_013844 [Puccinia striiformis f. sp. tritici PST-130]|nr:hypothetical protein KEM48_013844 [Puccinia striiformis f. sp. tritici PST-130]